MDTPVSLPRVQHRDHPGEEPGAEDVERQFYLDHFRGRSLVLAQPHAVDAAGVREVVDALTAAGARVVRVHTGDGLAVRQPVGPSAPRTAVGEADPTDVAAWWPVLRRTGAVSLAAGQADQVWGVAAAVAAQVRAFKLVLLDQAAPSAGDAPPPYVVLEGAAPADPLTRRLAWAALDAGVGSVNVCRAGDVAAELLTYRGAGVLYTREQYCRVGRLGLDDFDSAMQMVQQGVADGYLLPRSEDEVCRLLVHAYGARFGDDHLAGLAALVPHPGSGMAEVSALTTISRFAGGGVGGMIVRRMLHDAREDGLSAVFACTTSAQAAGFFTALGFEAAPFEALPDSKWADYDPARRADLTVLVHRLG